MITEIKQVARRHLASEGANLSLRAVARDMGMVSSALYRYFASRDDLLTALIIDAYDAIGADVEAADAGIPDRIDLRGRWLACAHAVRDWALANPAEYALIFGSPVPGYAAPADTITPASRTPVALIRIVADGHAAGRLSDPGTDLPVSVRADLVRIASDLGVEVPAALLDRGVESWLQMFGTVSFELFGQFNNVITDRAAFFAHRIHATADRIGLPPEQRP
jgi:AcrR family transcriptional regulator